MSQRADTDALTGQGKFPEALPELKIAADGLPGISDAQMRYGVALGPEQIAQVRVALTDAGFTVREESRLFCRFGSASRV